MDTYPQTHGGGPAFPIVVDSTGTTVVIADQSKNEPRRRYAIITALKTNTNAVWLVLSWVDAPVVGGGVPLYPGDSYEIRAGNRYTGPIKAIVVSGTENLAVQVGL